MKQISNTNQEFIKIFGQSGRDVSHLEEAGLALMNDYTMRAAHNSAATHVVFGAATLPNLERYRTSLQRQRERLLKQLREAEGMRVPPEEA